VAEVNLAALLVAAGLPRPEVEYPFAAPQRKFRWDYAWPAVLLACEVDGGLYVGGRHSRGAGREKDMEKNAEGLLRGWRCLYVSPRHVRNGQAVAWLEQLLKEEV
jgi:hypothetical protein